MYLRPLVQEDSKNIFLATYNDWDIHHALMGYYCNSLEDAHDLVTKLLGDDMAKPYAICNDNNEFLGVLTVYFHSTDGSTDRIEVSSFIWKRHRGKGYAAQSLNKLFKMYPGSTILFDVDPDNWRSISVMKKIQAKKEKDSDYYYVQT